MDNRQPSSSKFDVVHRAIKARPMHFAFGALALVGTNLMDVLTPLALKYAIDGAIAKDSWAVTRAALFYLALAVLTAGLRQQWRIHFGRFHFGVAHLYRMRIFRSIIHLGQKFFDRHPVGELMSLMINDVNTVRMGIGSGMILLIDGLTLLLFILPLMFWLSWSWTVKVLILLPLVPFFIRKIEDRLAEASERLQAQNAALSGVAQENIYGIRVTRAFVREQSRLNLFAEQSLQTCDRSTRLAQLDARFEPLMQFPILAGAVLLLVVGGQDVIQGTVGLGTFVAFYQYVRRMIWPMAALGVALSQLEQSRASDNRIETVVSEKPEVPVQTNGVKIDSLQSIEFRNLSYRYPTGVKNALDSVSLKFTKGEIIGITGAVGSGKSTLIQILTGLRKAPEQSVFVNGTAIERIDIEHWRTQTHIVTQDPFLFSWTVRENVIVPAGQIESASRFLSGTQASSDLLFKCLERVDLFDELERMPEGLDARLGEKGLNLSGGQRQRLTLARAIYRMERCPASEPGILILDDCLSAVDPTTERIILGHLQAWVKERRLTAIIITHRELALSVCNRVYRMEDGRLVHREAQMAGAHA